MINKSNFNPEDNPHKVRYNLFTTLPGLEKDRFQKAKCRWGGGLHFGIRKFSQLNFPPFLFSKIKSMGNEHAQRAP